MAIPIKIYTGKTSRKDIIIDLVRVVANPIRKNNAKDRPTSVVILFIVLLTFLFQPPSNSKKPMIHHTCHRLIELLKVNYFLLEVKVEI